VIPEDVWEDAGKLPCVLTIDLPLRCFTVRDLLRLERGAILESENANGAHVPVTVNSRLLGWAEFEVVEDRLAVRMTELA
jgi:flagellar motor switch protein FliN/FliY